LTIDALFSKYLETYSPENINRVSLDSCVKKFIGEIQNNDAIIQTLSKKMEAVFVNRMKINDNAQKDEIRA